MSVINIENIKNVITYYQTDEPTNIKPGEIWFNPDNNVLSIRKQNNTWQDSGASGGTGGAIGDRSVIGGGVYGSDRTNIIEYITISTLGNAHYFGDLTDGRMSLAATSNGTNDRGLFEGGIDRDSYTVNIIDYVTISTPGDALDFGDGFYRDGLAATSNGTNDRAVFGAGYNSASNKVNTIDYVTISTPGNSQLFGQLTVKRNALAATSNATNERGVFGGGRNDGGNVVNTIDYITISTPGNALDFGDLKYYEIGLAATSNGTNERGVFGGNSDGSTTYNTIDYITISTPGNALDFGDLTVARAGLSATSNGVNDRGLFEGGQDSNQDYNTIDYITISTPGNAQDFGDLNTNRHIMAGTSNA